VVTTLDEAQRVICELQAEVKDATEYAEKSRQTAIAERERAEKRWYELRDRYACAALSVCEPKQPPDELAGQAFNIANAMLRRRRTGIPPYESAT